MKISFFKKAKEIEKQKTRLDYIRELGYDTSHGYSLLRSSKTLSDKLLEYAKDYDEYGYISQELGDELDTLFEDKDYIVGIHRTGYSRMNEETIKDIFERGLINNGDIMCGANNGQHNLEKTVSIFFDHTLMNGQLKAAHGYKDSEGCIIVKMPKSYIGKGDGAVQPIFYEEKGISRLLPEFIYGYIPVSGHNVGNIIHNNNYKDQHNILNGQNLYYDDGAYYKAKRENRDLNNDLVEARYSILIKAYNETLNKYNENQADTALLNLINNNEVKYFTGKENREILFKYLTNGIVLDTLKRKYGELELNMLIQAFKNNAITSLNEGSKIK